MNESEINRENDLPAVHTFDAVDLTAGKETKTFVIFGEEITCSNTLILYHSVVDYYSGRKESFYQELCQQIPHIVTSAFTDVLPFFCMEGSKTVSRLTSLGVTVNTDAINLIVQESYQAIAEVVASIKTVYDGLYKNVNDAKQFGLDVAKFESDGNAVYAKYISQTFPRLCPGISCFMDALCEAEINYLLQAGLIDETVRSVNVQQSFELLNGIADSCENNSFTLAVILKKYPCNIAAFAHAKEFGCECPEMGKMIHFLELDKAVEYALNESKKKHRLELYLKIKDEVKTITSYDSGVSVIKKSAGRLEEEQVKDLLNTLAGVLTPLAEKRVQAAADAAIPKYQSASQIVERDAWTFFQRYGVPPIQSSTVITTADYAEFERWFLDYLNAKNAEKEARYAAAAKALSDAQKIRDYTKAMQLFEKLGGYKDSRMQCQKIEKTIKRKKQAKQVLSVFIAIILISCAIYIGLRLYVDLIIPGRQYSAAMQLYISGEYDAAREAFEALDGFKDSEEQINNCYRGVYTEKYNRAVALFNSSKFEEAHSSFSSLIGMKESDYDDLCNQIERCKTAILDEQYNAALALYEVGQYKESITAFTALDGYKDSDAQIEKCNTAILDEKYNSAVALYWAGKYTEAINRFTALNGYRDSDVQIEKCNTAILDEQYNSAVALYRAGKYTEAIDAFTALNGYSDSTAQIEKCNTAIKDEQYNAAVLLYSAGKYQEAINAFNVLNGYRDSIAQIEKCNTAILDEKYIAAITLYQYGAYEEAISAFSALDGYRDSLEKITDCNNQIKNKMLEPLRMAEVGDVITYGSYEQDNDKTDGKEGIEWLVLAKEDARILVISKYVLDWQIFSYGYKYSYTPVTWESSVLREWLNNIFLKNAFNEKEQPLILNATVSDIMGNTIMDKVFLLNRNEALSYFNSDEDRIGKATPYVITQGNINSPDDLDGCYWWLRSTSGTTSSSWALKDAHCVRPSGNAICSNLINDCCGVRPAMWLSLENLE